MSEHFRPSLHKINPSHSRLVIHKSNKVSDFNFRRNETRTPNIIMHKLKRCSFYGFMALTSCDDILQNDKTNNLIEIYDETEDITFST